MIFVFYKISIKYDKLEIKKYFKENTLQLIIIII